MQITQITVSYGETQSLPEYSNVKPLLSITATLDEGEDVAIVEAQLWEHAKDAVHAQIDAALEANDKAAKYSTEPRYQVMRTYQGYTAHGKIDQPKIVVVFPTELHLDEQLDKRLGSVSYRETKNLRYSHAMRIATEYAHDQQCVLLDCADGDISRLEALLPPLPEELPEELPAQHPIDAQVADLDDDEWESDDEE
jgi:hypothetical protein